jgi:hypothetical protein
MHRCAADNADLATFGIELNATSSREFVPLPIMSWQSASKKSSAVRSTAHLLGITPSLRYVSNSKLLAAGHGGRAIPSRAGIDAARWEAASR